MNLSDLILGFAIFTVVYQGVDFWLESRAHQTMERSFGRSRSGPTQSLIHQISNFGAKLGVNRMFLRNKKFNERLHLLLLRAGFPFGWNVDDFLVIKEMGVAWAALMLWLLEVTQPLIWPVGLLIGFWLPDFYLKVKGTARMAAIQRELPGLVDLIALTLESGLDLLVATERILEKLKPSALREELQTLLQETRLGTPRKEAFQHLSFRVNLPDIQSLSANIIQSEELGTGLASLMRSYAEDMRNRRIFRAEEVAGKAPVKLLFPIMVFFFPIVFVVIFGPLALNFLASYK
jgi:tight adherence protein C